MNCRLRNCYVTAAAVLVGLLFIVSVAPDLLPDRSTARIHLATAERITNNLHDESPSSSNILLNLIEDTPDGWRQRLKILAGQLPKQIQPLSKDMRLGREYFQMNWEPVVACPHEMRVGRAGDGGKWVCNLERIPEAPLIYSIGSNGDFDFEESMLHFFPKAEVHTFDFGDFAHAAPQGVSYHKWGLADRSYKKADGPEFYDLVTILEMLGHAGKTIDVLKIDIEHAEFDTLIPILESGRFPSVNQVQIEVHFFNPDDASSLNKLFRLFREKAHLEIFHKESNTQFSDGDFFEFSFVRVEWPRLIERGVVSRSDYDAMMRSAQPNYAIIDG